MTYRPATLNVLGAETFADASRPTTWPEDLIAGCSFNDPAMKWEAS